jgi:group I intron endonuclease
MGYIYIIKNKINNKVYIGQTVTSINRRMTAHYTKAKNGVNLTGIDAAIRKYGKDSFDVNILCECSNERLDEMEKHYIKKYKSFNGKGYNLSTGGQDSTTYLGLVDSEIISKYSELKNIKKVAKLFRCSQRTISDILHSNNVIINNPSHGNATENLKKGWVYKFKKGDGVKPVKIVELDKMFESVKACAQWLMENGYSKAKTNKLTSKSLCRALKNKRGTYCKLHFEYIADKDK